VLYRCLVRETRVIFQTNLMMLFRSVFAATALLSAVFAAPVEERRQSKLKWFGINESGAEFGEKNFTGS
jgi:endoglucanase